MASAKCIRGMIEIFSAHWPKHPIAPNLLSVYASCFPNVPDDILKRAAVLCVKECTFWPQVVELNKRIAGVLMPQLPSQYDAWQEVKSHLRAGHAKDEWSTPIIGKALDGIGGLRAFGLSPQEDESYWRTAFFKAYESYRVRHERAVLRLPAGKMLKLEG